MIGTVPALVVGLAVVLGHIWSPFLRGQGGKGVATSLGAILAVQPWFALVMVVVFGLLVWRMRWVAGASVSACLVLLLLGLGTWVGWLPGGSRDVGAWCVVLALIVIYRHRRNIELWILGAPRRLVHTLNRARPTVHRGRARRGRGARPVPSVPVCRCAAARRNPHRACSPCSRPGRPQGRPAAGGGLPGGRALGAAP